MPALLPHRRVLRGISALGAVALLTACTTGGTAAEESTLTVLGAASTRVINGDLAARAAQLDPPLQVDFLNMGSSTLVQQLADGAPGDLLITADRATMDRAETWGTVAEPQVVATNTLVMVVPAGNPAGITAVTGLDAANLALCDPQVPCGSVAAALIDELGITVRPVSLEHSVTDALGRVTSGEADAGWVYRTDAVAAGEAVEVIEIPGATDHPTAVMAAVTTGTDHPERARALFGLLTSPELSGVWAEHGFTSAP